MDVEVLVSEVILLNKSTQFFRVQLKKVMHGKKSKILKRQMYSDKHARLEQTQTLIKTKCSHLNGNEEKSSMHILGGPIKMLLQNNFLLSFR